MKQTTTRTPKQNWETPVLVISILLLIWLMVKYNVFSC